jgi:mono/diheme cytochrome c family protein
MQLHWDGNNTSVDERNLSAALGAGVTPLTVDHAGIKRVRDWIWTLKPPPYPFAIDQARAAAGKPLYAQYCQSCHAGEGFRNGEVRDAPQVGKVVPLASIGTDPSRLY